MIPLDPCDFWLDSTVKQHLANKGENPHLWSDSCTDQTCKYIYQLNLLLLLVPCNTRRTCRTHTEYRILTLEGTNRICVAVAHKKEGRETRHRFTTSHLIRNWRRFPGVPWLGRIQIFSSARCIALLSVHFECSAFCLCVHLQSYFHVAPLYLWLNPQKKKNKQTTTKKKKKTKKHTHILKQEAVQRHYGCKVWST